MLSFEQEMYVRFASDAMVALLSKKTYERSDNLGQPRIPNEVARLSFDAADLMMEEFGCRQLEAIKKETKSDDPPPLTVSLTPKEVKDLDVSDAPKKSVGQKADSLSPTQRAKLLKANPLKRGMKARF